MPDPTVLLLASPGLLFAAALAVVAMGRRLGALGGWVVLATATASATMLGWLATRAGAPPVVRLPWIPSLGVELALRGDPYGLFLALLVTGIGALVSLYAIGYLADADDDKVRRFWAALPAFMGAMVGIALADDLILLFVCWELTSITSFLLIGFYFERDDARAGALTALQVTALGGLAMSVGILLVGIETGSFSLSALAGDPERVARFVASPAALPAMLLLLAGAFTKSAQVPFHFWLPRAMVAPTPVSTYLHAATMVKAGVFLLGRIHPIFGGMPLWTPLVAGVGGATMVLGAYQAFRETDLKAILARTTVSALGMVTMIHGLGIGAQDTLQLANHAAYKGTLFLVAGIVEHTAHTRDLRELGGLGRRLPIAFVACCLGALAMAGVAPTLGFLAKETLLAAVLECPALAGVPPARALVVVATVLTGAFLVAVALRIVVGVFLAPMPGPLAHRLERQGHHGARGLPLELAPCVLAAVALGGGLAGATDVVGRLGAATSSVAHAHLHVSLVPHPGPPLFGSLVALVLGVLFYAARRPLAAVQEAVAARLPATGPAWDALMHGAQQAGEQFSGRWQNGSLRWYLAVTLLAAPLLILRAMGASGVSFRSVVVSFAEAPWYGTLLCALLIVTTGTAVLARTRLAAAIATTTIGFFVSMLFVVYRSPDILLTQILIETVSTIFVLLVLVFLPAFPKRDLAPAARVANALVAGVVGVVFALAALLAMTPGYRELDNVATRPGGLLSLSRAQGGGANAVNVIIVDIRALDTNGEITVLVVVGLCIYALLRARRRTA